MGLAASRQEAFWEACGFGHLNRVKKFLEDPAIDVNWISYTHNCRPIHVASQGRLEIVKLLVEKKCDVNVKDERGNYPIHHAAQRGQIEIMELLLSAGSAVSIPDKNGWTPLINAAYYCHPEAVRLLIRYGADVQYQNKDDRTALHEACRSPQEDEEGLVEIVTMLIEKNADINQKSSDNGAADFTPLMFACYHCHPGVAKVLIDAQCDLDAQGSNKWTALHWAADRNHPEMIMLLLQSGVDPMKEGVNGELAMHRTKDNEMRYLIEQAIIAVRGECETDEDNDSETEKEVEYEKDTDEIDCKSYQPGSSHPNLPSPVTSEPDAMDKDKGSEKEFKIIDPSFDIDLETSDSKNT